MGSLWVARLCAQEPIAISLIAVPELASALARRTHEAELNEQQRDLLFQAFLRDARSFTVIQPGHAVSQQAAAFLLAAPSHIRLRTLDALQLASAKLAFDRARRRGVTTRSFITADRALVSAADWAGLPTENPEDH
ncbi:MAG TPA: type II toxin-antitoxin system VapC family toxin, partial [Chloroflexota bacterium]